MIQPELLPVLPSLELLDMQAVETLGQVALVIEQEPLGRWFTHLHEAKKRTRIVGEALAELLGGWKFTYEGRLDVATGMPEHVDGFSNYWQVHTSISRVITPPKDKESGMLLMLREYNLEAPLDKKFFQRMVGVGVDPTQHERSFRFREDGERRRAGIVEEILKTGGLAPVLRREFHAFVPLGATTVFINGADSGCMLYTHETKNAYRDTDGTISTTYSFWRDAVVGSVARPT